RPSDRLPQASLPRRAQQGYDLHRARHCRTRAARSPRRGPIELDSGPEGFPTRRADSCGSYHKVDHPPARSARRVDSRAPHVENHTGLLMSLIAGLFLIVIGTALVAMVAWGP